MNPTRSPFGLTGNLLKLIAMLTMTIDHIGVILLPQYRILRIIGRLTMPIYAFMIAEGCHYTHRDICKAEGGCPAADPVYRL